MKPQNKLCSHFKTISKYFSLLLVVATVNLISFDSSASRNGTPVTGKYPNVVLISGAQGNGTGVFIAPDLVLTANHVPGSTNLNWVKVYVGYSIHNQPRELKVVDKKVLSTDSRSELTLLKLKKPVDMTPDKLYLDPLLPETKVFGIGYGITGESRIHHPSALEAEMIFTGYYEIPDDGNQNGILVSQAAGPNIMGQLAPGPMDQISCSGDSGGPVMIKTNGKLQIVGITSSILADGHDGTENGFCLKAHTLRFIPLSSHIDWIQEAARELDSPLSLE